MQLKFRCAVLTAVCAAAFGQQPAVTLIEAGRVLDVRTGKYAQQQGILVESGRI
jgi:hypothetical protein